MASAGMKGMAPAQHHKSRERLRPRDKPQERIWDHHPPPWGTQGLGALIHGFFRNIFIKTHCKHTFVQVSLEFRPESGVGITLSCESRSFVLGKQSTHPRQKIPRSGMNIPSPVEARAPNDPAPICGIHQPPDNSLRRPRIRTRQEKREM